MPYLEILEANSPIDDTPVDVVFHFSANPMQSINNTAMVVYVFSFFPFGGQGLDTTTTASRTAAGGVAFGTSLCARFADDRSVCLYQSFG